MLNRLSLVLYALLAASSFAADLTENEDSLPLYTYTIKQIDDAKEVQDLCDEHQRYHQDQHRDFSKINFNGLQAKLNTIQEQKKHNLLDEIFGIYGFYLEKTSEKEVLVGIIQMLGANAVNFGFFGYAECEMTMHPNYRGIGLGYIFRKQFHEQIIQPNLGKNVSFQNKEELIFEGTLGYVHAYNIASRRLVTKLGFVPARLSCKPYLGGREALQIMYINPSKPISYELPSPLPPNTQQAILENNLENTCDILINYLNQEELISKCLQEARKLKLEDIRFFEIPLERIFVSVTESFIKTLLVKAADQPLLMLAQEVALLENFQKISQQEKLLSQNGPCEAFLKKNSLEVKRKKLLCQLSNS